MLFNLVLVFFLVHGSKSISIPANTQPVERDLQKQEEKIDFSLPSRIKFRSQFDDAGFIFHLNNEEATKGDGGTAQAMDVDNFAASFGERLSLTRFVLEPCGINLPHVHPRAAEVQYVISAGPEGIQTAFVEENGGRGISNIVYDGDVSLFPRGLVHFQMNMGCKPAELLSSLSFEDPGVLTITNTALQNLPKPGLAASLGISEEELYKLISGVPGNPASGGNECLTRCNIY